MNIYSLRIKLVLAFVMTSVASILLIAFLIQQFVAREFDAFILEQQRENFIERIENYYQFNGSLEGVERYMVENQPLALVPPRDGDEDRRRPAPPIVPIQFVLVDQQSRVVIPLGQYRIGMQVPDNQLDQGLPVVVDGETIATVLTTSESLRRDPDEEAYLGRTNNALVIATIGAVALAILIGMFMARLYLRPLRELTSAVKDMRQGDLKQQVPVRSRDELGMLAEQFNQMSNELARANQLRRQMTADIAHDLRTPLTVIAGYLESLRDGVLKPTAERFAMMHDETSLLQHLVEDLRLLSLADAGELKLDRSLVSIRELLNSVAQKHQLTAQQNRIIITVDVEHDMSAVSLDPVRMMQVLDNLVGNGLRYTPVGGEIKLSAQLQEAKHIVLKAQDNGEGIPSDVLPDIFERFYRADLQRSGDATGLGLAIAKSIVELHGGVITVESKPMQGTCFTITLPIHEPVNK